MSNFFLKDFIPSFPLSQVTEHPVQYGQIYLTDFFKHLGISNDEKIKNAVALFQPSIYRRGQVFLRAGETANKIGFILSGTVELFYADPVKQQVLFCFAEEDFFTDLKSFFYQVPSKVTIGFTSDTIVLEIDHSSFNRFITDNPEFAEMLLRIMTSIVCAINEHNLTLKLPTRERYNKLLRLRPHLLNRFPLRTIASYLGVKQETLSRIRGQFKHGDTDS